MLRIGVVTDSAAQLPLALLAHPSLRVLPVKIQAEGEVLLDEKDPAQTESFIAQYLDIKKAGNLHSKAFSSDEIRAYYLAHLGTKFDHVFGLFVMGARSPLFKNASDAASEVISQSMAPRAAIGLKGPLFVEAYDSATLTDGLSVLVQDILALVGKGATPGAVRARVNEINPMLYTYVVPSQLDFIATRAKARGDQSAGGLAIAAAKLLGVIPVLLARNGDTGPVVKMRGVEKARDHALNLALREVQRGLKSPFLSVSYSGNLSDITNMPTWQRLVALCNSSAVSLSLKQLSPTNAINLGPDGLSVGFAAVPHSPEL
jgi:fatty acid-binding protein DegV